MWVLGGVAVALVVVGIVLGIVLSGGGGSSKQKRALTKPIDWTELVGLQDHGPPWPANGDTLAERISSLGVNALQQEALAYHIHAHLDVFVDGKAVAIPQGVGFGVDPSTGNFQFITELHTHQADGIIHVEAPERLDYVLGQFFGEWGVRLTSDCLGPSCGKLRWYVDGKRRVGNPSNLVLRDHEEIAIVSGAPPAKIPSSFDFSAHGV